MPSELLNTATPIQPESEVLLPSEDCSAVMLDNGIEDETPVALWNAAISKYNLLQQAEENLAKLAMSDEKSEKQELEEKKQLAVKEAIQALRRVHHDKMRQQLLDFEKSRDRVPNLLLRICSKGELLNSYDATFWLHCFTDLFYRADCWEKHAAHGSARSTGRVWLKTLFKRMDFSGWVLSKELAAVAANV